MEEKQGSNKQNTPQPEGNLMDTQRLLLGEPAAEGNFALEDILEEFEGVQPPPAPEEQAEAVQPPPVEEPETVPGEPPKPPQKRKGKLFRRKEEPLQPEPPPEEEPDPAGKPAPKVPPPPEPEPPAPEEPGEEELADLAFWADLLRPEEIRAIVPEEPAPPEEPPEEPAPPPEPELPPGTPPEEAPPETPPQEETPPPQEEAVSMEDVVASTVDAVREEQEIHQEKVRKYIEKLRRQKRRAGVKRKEPSPKPPLPEADSEPSPGEAAARAKRRWKECRGSLRSSLAVLILLWTPWVLVQAGVEVPFFSESVDNAALCVLVPQALISVLCWPVYRAALEGLREGAWTISATAAMVTLVTLLDEMTMLLLPLRTEAAPLGGVAAALCVFALWGLASHARGAYESFRTAAMGTPTCLVDCCKQGIAKGSGSVRGFYTRLNMEDVSAQWQRLLLPVLAAASLVFGALSSAGQGRMQDLLWCCSVVLCFSSALVFPLAFSVPFGRLAAQLSRSGAAVAGQYGAADLASSRRIVVTDGDLFPLGSVGINDIKLYGEEQDHALAYAAALAIPAGGAMGRLFEGVCRSARIRRENLEHFHIHEHGGLSGMIHGETVLAGPPVFMRHMAVRLPGSMPAKPCMCLAVDGTLTAVFILRYSAAETVSTALRGLGRSGVQLTLGTRDGNITSKLLRSRFHTDGGANTLELDELLALSDPARESDGPSGLLYREGLLPYASLVTGSRRLCQTAAVGDLLAILSSVSGVLLGFYLTFTGSWGVLTPLLILTYLLLWVVPVLPLVWTVDKL